MSGFERASDRLDRCIDRMYSDSVAGWLFIRLPLFLPLAGIALVLALTERGD